jgi:hypothetical protein
VRFGGRIDKEGYLPGRIDVTMRAANMRLRFPQGMRRWWTPTWRSQGTTDSRH